MVEFCRFGEKREIPCGKRKNREIGKKPLKTLLLHGIIYDEEVFYKETISFCANFEK